MGLSEDAGVTFERALLALDRRAARRVLEEFTGTLAPIEAAEQLMAPALHRIGEAWERGDVALSQVYMGGRICEELLHELVPAGQAAGEPAARIAVAVLGDYHVLGKRMVCAALHAAGLAHLDYGHGLLPRDLVERALADHLEILLLSALLLPSALSIVEVQTGLRAAGSDCRIIVGGAPFLMDDTLWIQSGADAMGRSASDAPRLVRQMVKGDGV